MLDPEDHPKKTYLRVCVLASLAPYRKWDRRIQHGHEALHSNGFLLQGCPPSGHVQAVRLKSQL